MRTRIFTSLVLCALLLSACNLPQGMMKDNGLATIVFPLDGQQFNAGDLVDVKTTISGAPESVPVVLLVNAAPYRADSPSAPLQNGTIYQPWTPTEPGVYTLQVTTGGLSSNSVTVTVGAVDVPSEAPTLSSAPTIETTTQAAPTLTALPTSTNIAPPVVFPTNTVPAPVIPTFTEIVVIPTKTATALANASLSGFVYRDENGNGNFNPADMPLAGVTVQLGLGACPSSGFQSTQTGGDGKYTFNSLPAGNYCLTVNTSTLPSIGGTWQASLPNPSGVNLASGENLGGRNFMFQPIIQ